MKRTVLAAAVAMVAVAATVVTVTVLTGLERSPADPPRRESTPTLTTSPTPAPTSTPTPFQPAGDHDWLLAVPEDLSLSAGLPEDGGDFERVSEAITWTFCDTEAFPADDVLDVRREGATGPEYADRRDLRVFRNDRAAHAFLERVAAVALDCPEEQHGASLWIHTVDTAGPLGEESLRILQTYKTDGLINLGATWWTLVRVGNAVLLTATGGEYLPGENLGQGIREHDQLLAPLVGSMCVFAAQGCPSDGPLVLEHDGIGPLRLGMSVDEARAVGAEVRESREGCARVSLRVGDDLIGGYVDSDLGVSYLYGSEAITPEGITTLATAQDVRDTYPEVVGWSTSLLTVPLGDASAYRMQLAESWVDSLTLQLDGQSCGF